MYKQVRFAPDCEYAPQLQEAPYQPQCPPQLGAACPAEDEAYPPQDKGYASSAAAVMHDYDLIRRGGHELSDPDIKRAFTWKVCLILGVQFAVTVATVLVMHEFIGNHEQSEMSSDEYHKLMDKVFVAMWVCLAIFIITKILLVCCERLRRKGPINVILLTVFTLAMSGFAGCITMYYSNLATLIAMGSTCIVTLGLVIFACQRKAEFTCKDTYIFAIFLVFLFCIGVLESIVLASSSPKRPSDSLSVAPNNSKFTTPSYATVG